MCNIITNLFLWYNIFFNCLLASSSASFDLRINSPMSVSRSLCIGQNVSGVGEIGASAAMLSLRHFRPLLYSAIWWRRLWLVFLHLDTDGIIAARCGRVMFCCRLLWPFHGTRLQQMHTCFYPQVQSDYSHNGNIDCHRKLVRVRSAHII